MKISALKISEQIECVRCEIDDLSKELKQMTLENNNIKEEIEKLTRNITKFQTSIPREKYAKHHQQQNSATC